MIETKDTPDPQEKQKESYSKSKNFYECSDIEGFLKDFLDEFIDCPDNNIDDNNLEISDLIYNKEGIQIFIGKIDENLAIFKIPDKESIEFPLVCRECQSLTKIGEHPNIPSLYGAGYTPEGQPFIALEYIPGYNLGSLLDQYKNNCNLFPLHFSLDYLSQLSKAITHIHSKDILHRDINPNNILIKQNQKKLSLIDFNISLPLDSEEYKEDRGFIEGTIEYISPNTWLNNIYSKKTDLYGLGVTTWELILNKTPYGREIGWDNLNIFNKPLDLDLPFIYEPIKQPLRRFLKRAVDYDKGYTDIADYVQDLEDLKHRASQKSLI